MPVSGGGQFGTPSNLKFGSGYDQFLAGQPGGSTTDQVSAYRTYAGVSLAYPDLGRVGRAACAEIWAFDNITWLPTVQLQNIGSDGVRSASLNANFFQQETLSFTVSDPAYYRSGGGGAGLLDIDKYVVVKWTTQVPGLPPLTYYSPPYRLVNGIQESWDQNAGRWIGRVSAPDFASAVLAPKNNATSYVLWTVLNDWAQDYVAAGLPLSPSLGNPPIDTASAYLYTIGTEVFAAIWVSLFDAQAGSGFAVTPWSTILGFPDPRLLPTPPPSAGGGSASANNGMPYAVTFGSAGSYTNRYDMWNALFPLVGGFRTGFRDDGKMLVSQRYPSDSGLFISCDGTIRTGQPLAWTRPIRRALSVPQYGQVTYQRVNSPPPEPPAGGGRSAEFSDFVANFYVSNAWAIANPYRGQVMATEAIVDRDTDASVIGFSSPQEMVNERMRDYLGGADTVSFSVDPTQPPPPCGRLIRIHLPPDIDGWYMLTGFSQPQGGGLAQWQTQWWSDV